MAAYSESELRYAKPLAENILVSADFRRWMLSGTRFEEHYQTASPLGHAQACLRSPGMKNPYWFNYWCGKDSRCACRIGSGIETDILIVLEADDLRRLALHIEVKRPGEKLGLGQAESYPRRAACWADPSTRPRTVPPHQDFLTMVVCGGELRTDARLQNFDKVILHKDVAAHIHPYPEGLRPIL